MRIRAVSWAALAVIVTLAVSGTSVSRAEAGQPVAERPGSDSRESDQLRVLIAKTAEADVRPVQVAAKKRATLLASARQKAHAQGKADVVAGSARIRQVRGGALFVSYVLSGPQITPASNLTVFFSAKGEFLSTQQITYTLDTVGGGRVDVWNDGHLLATRTITAAQAVTSYSMAKVTGAVADSEQCTLTKIEWILVFIVCSLACVFSAGLVCLLCATAFTGATVNMVMNCTGLFGGPGVP